MEAGRERGPWPGCSNYGAVLMERVVMPLNPEDQPPLSVEDIRYVLLDVAEFFAQNHSLVAKILDECPDLREKLIKNGGTIEDIQKTIQESQVTG
mgnify:CR=1 FL=1